MMTDEDRDTLDAMIKHGGGFVSALAVAWYKADPKNFAKLKGAFPEYWSNYQTIAAEKKAAAAGRTTTAAMKGEHQ